MFVYYISKYYTENGNEYFNLAYTDFGLSEGFDNIRIVMFGFRDCILWFVFVTINVMLLLETRKHFRIKKRLRASFVNINGPIENNISPALPASINHTNMSIEDNRKIVDMQLYNDEKAEMGITRMVIITCVVQVFGQLTYFISILCTTITRYTEHTSWSWYLFYTLRFILAFAIFSNYVAFSAQFFIFYFFDLNFKEFIVKRFSKTG
jgi:hypothetical protein